MKTKIELDQKFAELFDENKPRLDRDDPLSLSWYTEMEQRVEKFDFDAWIASLESPPDKDGK